MDRPTVVAGMVATCPCPNPLRGKKKKKKKGKGSAPGYCCPHYITGSSPLPEKKEEGKEFRIVDCPRSGLSNMLWCLEREKRKRKKGVGEKRGDNLACGGIDLVLVPF